MYRCIITGLGNRGLYWAGEIAKHADCESVAYVEPAEPMRQRAVNEHQLSADQIFPSLSEAVKAVEADCVIDVTPPSARYPVAQEVFQHGLHLLSEKPLSDDYEVAQKLVKLSASQNVKHMIAQNYRFNAGARKMKQLLDEKRLGQVGQLDVQFYKAWADLPGSHYVTQPYMLINDMMVHHFDLMRYLLGADPVAVQAITWNQPWGWHAGDAAHVIHFEFEQGLRATHMSLGCSVGDTRKDYFGDWRLDGSEGSLSWSQGQIEFARMHPQDQATRQAIATEPVREDAQGILDEFTSAIREDRAPECNAADNLKSNAMVFAAIKSARERRRVALSELG